jgi:16S rRNA (guanine1516-N2)-methyltransferase
VDAAAGLGEDSLLLAAAGFEVTLFERDSLIAALLRDAVLRARDNPTLAAAANRMHVIEGDSIAGLRNLEASPDVVYLDPMFPARTKSAAVKKKLQVIQLLEHPCDDEAQLMEAALAARPRKVIIKRPIKGPHLAGIKPSYSLTGKAVRYDVLVPPR